MPLTDVRIRQAKPSEKIQKLADGGSLFLVIKPNGTKLWWYRYKLPDAAGALKENTYSIGEYPEVSLQDARKERDKAKELVKKGMHPQRQRQATKLKQLHANRQTFQAVGTEWLEGRKGKISDRFYDQIERGLNNNVFPYVGKMNIRELSTEPALILDILRTMEKRGAHTLAIMVLQWVSAIFRYGILTRKCDVDPAAALRGQIKRPPVDHAKPLGEEGIRDFWKKLARFGGNRQTAIALQLLLYLFVRTTEIRFGLWPELDWDGALWEIPGEKMKKRRTHLVPLPRQVIPLLKELHCISGSNAHGFMFPSTRDPNKVMSATTVNRALEYLGYQPSSVTGHDFRATASTLLHESGRYRPEVIEMQLAHVEKSMTKRAYNHAQYLPERTAMMQEWADWVDSLREGT